MITNHPQETSQASKLAVYREQKKLSHRLDKISICEERARKHTNAYQRRVEYELFGHPVRKSTGRYNKSYKEKRNRVLDTKIVEHGTGSRSIVQLPTIKQDVTRSQRSKQRRVRSPDISIFPHLSAAQSVDNILDERQVKYIPRNVDIKKERRTNDDFQRFAIEKQSDPENDGNSQKPLSQSTASGEKDSINKNTSNARKRRLLKKYGRRWLRKTIRKSKGSDQENPKIPGHQSDPDEEPSDLTNFISKMLEQYKTQKDDNHDTDFLESKSRKNKNIGGKYYASTAKLFATANNTKGISDRKKATADDGDKNQRRRRGRRDDKHFRRMSVVMQNSAMFVQGLEWENTNEQTTL